MTLMIVAESSLAKANPTRCAVERESVCTTLTSVSSVATAPHFFRTIQARSLDMTAPLRDLARSRNILARAIRIVVSVHIPSVEIVALVLIMHDGGCAVGMCGAR